MTQAELDLAISEIIVAQDKPRSTQNSHRRKQWENRRNWRLCTIGETCKLAYRKICPLAKQKPARFKSSKDKTCWDYFCSAFGSPWFMGGVYYHCDCGSHFKKYSYNCKGLRVEFNRRIRRTCKGEIGNYGYYRKMFDYLWGCV